jgi:hypothetical protein
LLDAWLAGGGAKYIDFCEQLVLRTIHPEDDVAARDLNNFEERWSYTVYLQQLARYLLLTESVERPGKLRHYAAASLVHYADWMCENALFSLDYPEKLEFPTETWAAQELRKGNVLLAAAPFVDAETSDRFRRSGKAILNRAWEKLMSFESSNTTRPLAIALQQGYIETFYSDPPASQSQLPSQPGEEFQRPTSFQPQRVRIRAGLKSPVSIANMSIHALHPARWWNNLRRNWHFELARRFVEKLR